MPQDVELVSNVGRWMRASRGLSVEQIGEMAERADAKISALSQLYAQLVRRGCRGMLEALGVEDEAGVKARALQEGLDSAQRISEAHRRLDAPHIDLVTREAAQELLASPQARAFIYRNVTRWVGKEIGQIAISIDRRIAQFGCRERLDRVLRPSIITAEFEEISRLQEDDADPASVERVYRLFVDRYRQSPLHDPELESAIEETRGDDGPDRTAAMKLFLDAFTQYARLEEEDAAPAS